MSLNHAPVNIDKNKETFKTSLNASLKTQKPTSIDENGVDSIRKNYADALESANNAKMYLRFEGMKFGTENEVPANEMKNEAEIQRELSMDKVKQESHSGKKSNQEKAANKRAAFGDLNYDTNTAQSVLTSYNAKKEQIERGEFVPQEYKCTGKEFLLPPLNNMGAEITDKIVNVMVERDRLEKELKNMAKPTRPYDKAAKKYKTKLLKRMNDVIDTFFLANGVNKDTGAALNNVKKVNTAKTHMALALEKYELLSRKIDENIVEEMLGDLKKNNDYTQKRDEVIENRKVERIKKSQDIKDYLYENSDAFKKNEAVILKVLAEYLELNKGADASNARLEGYKKAISNQANYGDVNRSEELSNVISTHLGHVERSMSSGAEACKAYIEYLIEGKRMTVSQAAFIKSRFGIVNGDCINKSLRMNVPLKKQVIGISQYDSEIKNKVNNFFETSKAKIAIMSEQDLNENEDFVKEMEKAEGSTSFVTKLAVYLKHSGNQPAMSKVKKMRKFMNKEHEGKNGTKFEYGRDGLLRDVVIRHASFSKDEVPSEAEMLKIATKTAIIDKGCDPENNKEQVSDEELYKTYHEMMPLYKDQFEELMDIKNKNPNLFNFDLSNPDFASMHENYEMYYLYSQKGQAVRDVFSAIAGNKRLRDMLSEEEKKECIRMGASSAAFFSVCNNWSYIYNRVSDLTPEELLAGAFDIKTSNAECYDKAKQQQVRIFKNKFKFTGDVD